jgi:hypothetical protein
MTRLLATLLLFLCGSLLAESPDTQFGANDYIEFIPGTLPLLIGAPHGGSLKPAEIPTRTYGVVDQDSGTQELARLIREAISKKTGGTPAMVISRLHRAKLDPNREIKEAAQGDPIAEQAWSDWQGFIVKAKARVTEQFGVGLYIDLHGQRHPEGRVELGYMIAPEKLREPDELLEKASLAIRASSIRELDQRSPASFVELLRGKTSLGGMLQERGYLSVPSPAVPAPKEGELYFRGGYNTDTHGSHAGGTFNAVQIECPWVGVRDTAANREKFADVLADVLPVWFKTHYGASLAPRTPSKP